MDNLFYRPYSSEIDSYPEKSFLKMKVPKIRFIEKNFEERLLKAKCLIVDHPGTTFDIAIAANIPTLLFTKSRGPPLFAPITGVPQAIHSINTIPTGSSNDGNTPTEAIEYNSAKIFCGCGPII